MLLHSGSATGLISVILAIKDSAGRYVADTMEQLLQIAHEDAGEWITGPVERRVAEAGGYWLEVWIDGRLLARAPFHIIGAGGRHT